VTRWPELATTGKQSTWVPGQQEQRSDTEAAQLLATGLFSDVDATQLPEQKVVAISGVVSDAGNHGPSLSRKLFGPDGSVTLTRTPGAGITVVGAGREVVDGEALEWATLTGSAANSWYEFVVPAFNPLSADTAQLEWRTDTINASIQPIIYLANTGYAQFAQNGLSMTAPASGIFPRAHTGWQFNTVSPTDWSKSGYSRDTIEQIWTIAKVRVNIPNGVTATIKLRALTVGLRKRRARLCIVADDGYSDWVGAGAQILARYGIKSTACLITDYVGTSSDFGSLADWRRYVDDGNMCVPHGPLGGTGNIFTRWASDADALADMETHRDYLLSNRLTNDNGAKCYVWPQGVFTRTAGDTAFLDLAWSAGFRVGRLNGASTTKYISAAYAGDSRANLILPVLGHSYQGVASTADDATETTNINDIIARIQALALTGCDSFLTFHHVRNRGAATLAIDIETDRLNTLCAAIQAEVVAGRLECVTMDKLVPAA